MTVLKTLWATGLSQKKGTPYLAVVTPTYSSSKEQGAEALVNLPGGSAFHTRSSVGQEPELSFCCSSAFCTQSWDISSFSFELKMYQGWNLSQGYDFLPSRWILCV